LPVLTCIDDVADGETRGGDAMASTAFRAYAHAGVCGSPVARRHRAPPMGDAGLKAR
jgi:hypothetical protein